MARTLAGPRTLAGARAPAGPRALRVFTPPAPGIAVSPATWNAGSVQTSGGSVVQVFTVSNPGGANLVMGTVVLTGTGYAKSADTVSGATIAPAGNATLTVTFDPTADGVAPGLLTLPSNALGSPVTVALTGTGVTTAGILSAFPGAEGFGAGATGGRGGAILFVDTLMDAGTGSARAALEATGPRIVIFRTGGTIVLQSPIEITSGDITVAGQTAPGGGITFRGAPVTVEDSNVIIRGIRVRNGTTSLSKPMWDVLAIYGPTPEGTGSDITDIIIDHCSMSWGVDDNLSTYGHADRVTMSWSIISECLHNAQHDEGAHSMGTLLGGEANNISFHHNLSALNNQRNPRIQGNSVLELVNNVTYGWGETGCQVSEVPATYDNGGQNPHVNFISNHFKARSGSSISKALYFASGTYTAGQLFYVAGNITPSRTSLAQAEWLAVSDGVGNESLRRMTPWPVSIRPITTEVYPDFLADLYAYVGAPIRDSVDARIVAAAQAGTGNIIDSPAEVGGWPALASGTYPTDTNGDGIPNAWATANGMGAAAANDTSPTGYTWIEDYINSLIVNLSAPPPAANISVSPMSWAAGGVDIAAGPVTQVFTVTNTGTTDLVMGTVVLTGTGFAKTADSVTGATIAPAADETITLTFDPSVVGPVSGDLTIPSSADPMSVVVPLSGTGTQAGSDPAYATALRADFNQSIAYTDTVVTPGTYTGAAMNAIIVGATNGTNAANRRRIIVAGCTINLTGTEGLLFNNKANLTFDGQGTCTINVATNGNNNFSSAFVLQSTTRISIRNLMVTSTLSPNQGTTSAWLDFFYFPDPINQGSERINGLHIRGSCSFTEMFNVSITGLPGWPVYTTNQDTDVWPDNLWVHGCTIRGGETSLAFICIEECVVEDNLIEDSMLYAIDFEPELQGPESGYRDVLIKDNEFGDFGWDAPFTIWFMAANPTDQAVPIAVMDRLTLRDNLISGYSRKQPTWGGMAIRMNKSNIKNDTVITGNVANHADTSGSTSCLFNAMANLTLTGNTQIITPQHSALYSHDPGNSTNVPDTGLTVTPNTT